MNDRGEEGFYLMNKFNNIHKEYQMQRTLALMLALSLGTLCNLGCDRETTVKKVETVSTPGGTTTTTTTKKIESSGDHAPANSSGQAVPPR